MYETQVFPQRGDSFYHEGADPEPIRAVRFVISPSTPMVYLVTSWPDMSIDLDDPEDDTVIYGDAAVRAIYDKQCEILGIEREGIHEKDDIENMNAFDFLSNHPFAPSRFQNSYDFRPTQEELGDMTVDEFMRMPKGRIDKMLTGISVNTINQARKLIIEEINKSRKII